LLHARRSTEKGNFASIKNTPLEQGKKKGMHFRRVFICLLVVSLRLTTQKVVWLYVHYHKTGHDLSHKLAQSFVDRCHGSSWDVFRFKHQNLMDHLNGIKTDIIAHPSPDMFYNWSTLSTSPTEFRIIHFVRGYIIIYAMLVPIDLI